MLTQTYYEIMSYHGYLIFRNYVKTKDYVTSFNKKA